MTESVDILPPASGIHEWYTSSHKLKCVFLGEEESEKETLIQIYFGDMTPQVPVVHDNRVQWMLCSNEPAPDADVIILCYSAYVESTYTSLESRWVSHLTTLFPQTPIIITAIQLNGPPTFNSDPFHLEQSQKVQYFRCASADEIATLFSHAAEQAYRKANGLAPTTPSIPLEIKPQVEIPSSSGCLIL